MAGNEIIMFLNTKLKTTEIPIKESTNLIKVLNWVFINKSSPQINTI